MATLDVSIKRQFVNPKYYEGDYDYIYKNSVTVGPPGEDGAIGPTGPQGPQGIQGIPFTAEASLGIESYVDSSSYYTDAFAFVKANWIKNSSVGSPASHTVYWNAGYLEASGTGGGLPDGSTSAIESYVNTSTYYDGSLNARMLKLIPIVSKTSLYTLAAADQNAAIECNGTFSVYLPTSLDIGFQAMIVNVGTGTITIYPGSGATVYSRDSSNDLRKQYGGATVYKRSSTAWLATGDLT